MTPNRILSWWSIALAFSKLEHQNYIRWGKLGINQLHSICTFRISNWFVSLTHLVLDWTGKIQFTPSWWSIALGFSNLEDQNYIRWGKVGTGQLHFSFTTHFLKSSLHRVSSVTSFTTVNMGPWKWQPLVENGRMGTELARMGTCKDEKMHARIWKGQPLSIPDNLALCEADRDYLFFFQTWQLTSTESHIWTVLKNWSFKLWMIVMVKYDLCSFFLYNSQNLSLQLSLQLVCSLGNQVKNKQFHFPILDLACFLHSYHWLDEIVYTQNKLVVSTTAETVVMHCLLLSWDSGYVLFIVKLRQFCINFMCIVSWDSGYVLFIVKLREWLCIVNC